MHSLKNTIVAVGLLGLSFVFYQMSAPNQSNLAELTPPIVTGLQSELAEVAPADKLRLPSLSGPEFESGNHPLGSSPLKLEASKPHDLKLKAPKIANPLASRPAFVPPTPTQPNESIGSSQPQPRPEAEFDFSRKSTGPALAPPNAQERDQSLITALKKQQQATGGSQSRVSNAFQPTAKVPAQQISLIRDPSVAPASKIDDINASNRFELQPTNNDPYADLTFETVWPTANMLVDEGKFRKTLQLLTHFHNQPDLNGPQRQRLNEWLDGLARKVVFSNEHHLTTPYISQPGDSLLELGRAWGVPGQLIYNINKNNIPNPLAISPGTELKKITGPINASIDLESNTLTMFVEGLYAGRFNIKVGTSGSPGPGDFKVVSKLPEGQVWQDANGTYPPGHLNNHYGKNWIGLEGSLCLHTVDPNTDNGHQGCIGLSEKDAADLFAILSEGSTVSIR